jgi:hypothetical protein
MFAYSAMEFISARPAALVLLFSASSWGVELHFLGAREDYVCAAPVIVMSGGAETSLTLAGGKQPDCKAAGCSHGFQSPCLNAPLCP